MSARASGPRVEFLWWRGCPSWERGLAELREQMSAIDLDPDHVEVIEVGSDERAERERFVGSPTIRVDGIDVQEPRGSRVVSPAACTGSGTAASPRSPIRPTSARP